MGRPRTTSPMALCQRLRIGDLLAGIRDCKAGSPILISLGGGEQDWPLLAAVQPVERTGVLEGVALAYRPDPYLASEALVRQSISVRWERDRVGRIRPRFVCPCPGCGRSADSLYLPPETDEFRCRRCAEISYRRQPSLPERNLPTCSGEVERVLHGCRALAQETGRRLNKRAPSRRHRRGEMTNASRSISQALRYKAVADLWRDSGWTVGELARLFGVSDRTIKRDLRAAREQGEVPSRRPRTPAADLREQAKDMLRRCQTLQEPLLEMARTEDETEGRRTWAAATQARLLREECRLVELLAALAGARQPRRQKLDLMTREPEWLDPELIALAASRQAVEEPPAG